MFRLRISNLTRESPTHGCAYSYIPTSCDQALTNFPRRERDCRIFPAILVYHSPHVATTRLRFSGPELLFDARIFFVYTHVVTLQPPMNTVYNVQLCSDPVQGSEHLAAKAKFPPTYSGRIIRGTSLFPRPCALILRLDGYAETGTTTATLPVLTATSRNAAVSCWAPTFWYVLTLPCRAVHTR